ncbi:MAG: UDP-N-acetylmuramoyl-L-alanyl-D-glutamate--2,6-diaminopimelate ligase [Firmicutes bacterium]|nr:UDP-N-acetylmuramoyl-L-alanyl-D-glutamate--2,6-diaminopimelate ligase [Bacillota bacterium]
MQIQELLKKVPFELVWGDLNGHITGICHDNRKIKKGDAFVCIRGARFDTHDRISDLIQAGAALIVTERPVDIPEDATIPIIRVESCRKASSLLSAAFYGWPAEKLTLIGITGSKGKTTATHMMADILRAHSLKTGTIGTNGAIFPLSGDVRPDDLHISGLDQFKPVDCEETPGHVCYELSNTTPDAMEIQMYLAAMVKAGCTHAVIEVSSQAMKQFRVYGIRFQYAVWTNIETGDHIGPNEHKDFDEYLFCKASLLMQAEKAYINLSDPHCPIFRALLEGCDLNTAFQREVQLDEALQAASALDQLRRQKPQIITYQDQADSPAADIQTLSYEETFDPATQSPGLSFSALYPLKEQGPHTFHVSLPGRFNMMNALPVTAIALDLGIADDEIGSALSHLHIRGRYDIVFDNGHFRVVVDFAHNGYSTRNHLKGLRQYRPGRLVCIFGADGNRSIYRRLEMGEAAASLADFSIVTAGHNRFETFEHICSDILQGIEKAEKEMGHEADYMVIPSRQKAIRFAIENAREGDLITILGLGHESYQEHNGVKYPHSDIEYVRGICAALPKEPRA